MKNITLWIILFTTFSFICHYNPALCYLSELTSLCQFYENSLRIAQITSFRSIAFVYLCPPYSTDRRRSPLYIQSNAKITSFAVHQADNSVLYLTENFDLFFALLYAPSDVQSNTTSSGLYERLSPLNFSNSSEESQPKFFEPIWSFTEIKPTSIALDWIHNLLYLLEGSNIYVSSLYRPGHVVLLLQRANAHLLQVLVCPQLSMLIWSQVDWTTGEVTISVAQQDGTEEAVVFRSASTYVQDMQIEGDSVYFVSGGILGEIPLREYHQRVKLEVEDHVRRYPIIGHFVSHFAILNSFIFKIQSSTLLLQNIQDSSRPVERIPLRYSWAASSLQQPFTLLHRNSQRNSLPSSEPFVCPPPDSERTICKDICLPNGFTSKFTCLCYSNDNECQEYGPHHGSEVENELGGKDIRMPNLEPDHPFSKLSPPTKVPLVENSTAVVFHSNFSAEDFFDSVNAEVHEQKEKVTTVTTTVSPPPLPPPPPTITSSFSSPSNSTATAKPFLVDKSKIISKQQQTISDELFLVSKLHFYSTTLSRTLWYLVRSALKVLNTSVTTTSNHHRRLLFRYNSWLDSHQTALLITFATGLFLFISLSVFAFIYLVASFSSSHELTTRANKKRAQVLKGMKKEKNFKDVPSEEVSGSAGPPEVSIISVNKLYMAPDLVQKELQSGTFHQKEPKLAFEDSFVISEPSSVDPSLMHHWAILESSSLFVPSTSKQQKTDFITSSTSTSSPSNFSSSSSSHEMTTFENWEYSQVATASQAIAEFSLLQSPPAAVVSSADQSKTSQMPLYL